MKNFAKIILVLIMTVIGLNSCKKEAYTNVTSDALIHYSGALGADGCGFLLDIQLNGNTYSAINLPTEYTTKDSTRVRVTYTLKNTVLQCGSISGAGFKQIEIKEISKL